MIFRAREVGADEVERETGWRLEERGLCHGDVCVPFTSGARLVAVAAVARALGMPLVEDPATGLIALGPRSGGRALSSADAPELELPDLDGRLFRLSSLRGSKVLLVAWAPW